MKKIVFKKKFKFKEPIIIEESVDSENATETPKRSARKRDRFGELNDYLLVI